MPTLRGTALLLPAIVATGIADWSSTASSVADRISAEWRNARLKAKGKGRGKGKGGGGRGMHRARRFRVGGEDDPLLLQHRATECSNTCASARNGKCEDGSFLMKHPSSSQMFEVKCNYGTDCEDCGPLPRRAPAATLAQAMPSAPPLPPAYVQRLGTSATGVAMLHERGIKVNAAWTRTQPSFLMPFTDPRDDIDVSRSMASASRTVEPLYNLYWHRMCEACCKRGGLMLDVGANFGYYSFLAARMGCRVVAWEPVPVFRAFVEAGVALNNLSSRVHIRSAVVSDVAGVRINLTVPTKGIWGTASVDGLNVDPSVPSPKYSVGALSETLDQVVREKACILKLDVEGYEPAVLRGAKTFLSRYAPAAILTEYTPGVMERHRVWHKLPEYPQSLRSFHEAGYAIWHLFGTGKNMQFGLHTNWSTAPLPPLARVTERAIRAEETNARNMLQDNSGFRSPGFAVPWDLHPRSLHAEFSHNTDIFLTLNHSAVPMKREVGVGADTRFGLGGGFCEHVLRDGTAYEMVGRLCLKEGRNESIQKAIELAEQPRPLRHRQTWHSYVQREGRKWQLQGPLRSSQRRMVRVGLTGDAAGAKGRGKGRGRGIGLRG